MKTKFKYLTLKIIALLVINSKAVFAQTSKADPKDNQGWYGAKFKLDLPSGWSTNIDYQARYVNDFQMYNGSYICIGGTKKVNKFIEIESDYRLALLQKGIYHRVSIGVEATKRIEDFDFGLRMLVQNQLQDFEDEFKESQKEGYWRVRLETKYALTDRINIYVSSEPIIKLGSAYSLDNLRNTTGLKLKMANRMKLNLFYIYRLDYAKKTYDRLFQVAGVNLEYTLKLKKLIPAIKN
jgi:hypothetical protein